MPANAENTIHIRIYYICFHLLYNLFFFIFQRSFGPSSGSGVRLVYIRYVYAMRCFNETFCWFRERKKLNRILFSLSSAVSATWAAAAMKY